jgi:predicted ATP-grasp superfamily ATP-dependent carboligase
VTDAKKSKILVTDASRGSALAIIRSLGRRGWRVVAADEPGPSPGLRSRYAGERLVYPPPARAPGEFTAALASAARDMGVDLIIPVTDDALVPLSHARKRFEGLCKLAIPDAEALAVTADKLRTVELARRFDVPVPRTHLVGDADEAVAYAEKLEWPVVLKPRASRSYRNGVLRGGFRVAYAGNAEELRACMKGLEGRDDVLLQEYASGSGQGVELLLDRGHPLAAFQHERLREIPVHGGASALRRSVALAPDLYAKSVEMLSALSWTGLAMVEFKIAGGQAKLMEINGRVWGSLPLAVHSGMDFPARLADLMLGESSAADVAPETRYDLDVYSRNLELDLMWIVSVLWGRRRHPCLDPPRRREALAALFELANPRYKFDVFSLDDPAPALTEIVKIVRKFRSKLGGT